MTQVDKQRVDFKRLGVLGDWDNPYLTMDFAQEADIIRSLGRIAEQGHISKGSKPVHWCTDCGSALAEAEVEYKDKESFAIDVRFPVVDQAAFEAAFHPGGRGPGQRRDRRGDLDHHALDPACQPGGRTQSESGLRPGPGR